MNTEPTNTTDNRWRHRIVFNASLYLDIETNSEDTPLADLERLAIEAIRKGSKEPPSAQLSELGIEVPTLPGGRCYPTLNLDHGLDSFGVSDREEMNVRSILDIVPVISSYSRAQAIADGVLIDVTEVAQPLGFHVPVALTAALYAAATECADTDPEKRARVERVLQTLNFSISTEPDGSNITTFITVIPGVAEIPMWALCGPGDTRSPVVTVMLISED